MTLGAELVDVLRDVSTDAVGVGRLGTDAYETGSIEHLRRTHVVLGDSGKESGLVVSMARWGEGLATAALAALPLEHRVEICVDQTPKS